MRPYVADEHSIPSFGEHQYPIEFVESTGAIKVSETDEEVTVAFVNDDDIGLITQLEDYHGKRIVALRIERAELAGILSRHLGEDVNAASAPEDDRLLIDELANDAPVVNFVNSMLLDGIRQGASDIHVEAASPTCKVRFRVDGVLNPGPEFPIARFAAISSRVKIIANLNILERRRPQDGRITVELEGHSIDLRASIVPTAQGESIVLRLFNRSDNRIDLEELGFSPKDTEVLRRLGTITHGLVLVTGPTGSGKTTTLNAMLRELERDRLKIITIEDPVEYLVDGVQQIQTNESIGLGFDAMLRRVLRQDPNVIMVGEIRDVETAELAVRAALTGHLVFATLHTNDAAGAITRLVDMGAKRYLIAATFRAAVAQRLLRRVCPHCSTTRETRAADRNLLAEQGLSADRLVESAGCEQCKQTGFLGRIAVAEIIEASPRIETMIADGADRRELARVAVEEGTTTLRLDGLRKALEGQTTLEEVVRTLGQ